LIKNKGMKFLIKLVNYGLFITAIVLPFYIAAEIINHYNVTDRGLYFPIWLGCNIAVFITVTFISKTIDKYKIVKK
jgi:hypothetical protein